MLPPYQSKGKKFFILSVPSRVLQEPLHLSFSIQWRAVAELFHLTQHWKHSYEYDCKMMLDAIQSTEYGYIYATFWPEAQPPKPLRPCALAHSQHVEDEAGWSMMKDDESIRVLRTD